MSGSSANEENILGHLQAVMQMISISLYKREGIMNSLQGIEPEYACLRSMMLEPQNPVMWNALALVYMMTNRFDDAREAIEQSLDIDTSIAWTWSVWGDLLGFYGEETESIRAYRMAVELGSEEPHVLKQLICYHVQRGSDSEALSLLEKLLPLCPDDQTLWDIYTVCFQSVHSQINAWILLKEGNASRE